MIRLLNYGLFFSGLCALLIILVPCAVNMYDLHLTTNELGYNVAKNIAMPFYKPGISLSLAIVFLIISSVVFGLVWYFWIKLNYNSKKVHDFPVDTKWIKSYKIIALLSIATIVFAFIFMMVGWGINLGYPQDYNAAVTMAKTRWWIYISGLVVCALLTLGIMGYNAYINLMISYDQQKQYVDKQVELGNYDPITRRPKDEVKNNSDEIKEVAETKTTNDDTYYGSSGLVKDETNQ